jgi:transglutaminase superfamily protein
VCRHFTTLHVALLRYAGIPARARVGFARYFGDGWGDHWITEWWDGERWVRTDSQVGPVLQNMLGLAFDPADQPAGEFLTAPEAWQRCRAGEEDPTRFGIFNLRGLGFVAGSIVQDLAALNKVELLPWDVWGDLSNGPRAPLADAQLRRGDEVARSMRADDLDKLRALFLEPDVAIPETITTIVDGRPVPATLDRALL